MIGWLKRWSWSRTFSATAIVFFVIGGVTGIERWVFTAVILLLWSVVAEGAERTTRLSNRITRLETRLREKGMLDG